MIAKIIFGIAVGLFTIVGSIADLCSKQKVELVMLLCILVSIFIYIPFIG